LLGMLWFFLDTHPSFTGPYTFYFHISDAEPDGASRGLQVIDCSTRFRACWCCSCFHVVPNFLLSLQLRQNMVTGSRVTVALYEINGAAMVLRQKGRPNYRRSYEQKVTDACRTRTCAPEGNRFLVYRYNHSAKAPG
jgi:hypothetical protein